MQGQTRLAVLFRRKLRELYEGTGAVAKAVAKATA